MNINDKVLDKIFFISNRYLDGKDIFPILRRIIDPLISISVASYLFEKFYFKYEWLDITDYKAIISFIVKGSYIIPLSVFLAIHLSIYYTSAVIFGVITGKISNYIKKIKLTDRQKLGFYFLLKSGDSEFKALMKRMTRHRDEAEKDVNFIFKLLLAICFYYFILFPNYGTFLFIVMMLLFFALLIAFLICFLIFDLLPPYVAKLIKDGEDILKNKAAIDKINVEAVTNS